MKTAFRNLAPNGPRVPVRFDGLDLLLPDGANLAAALLEAGVSQVRRSPVSGAPRGPFCMMGACFDCLVVLDGVTRQACMLEVAAGMDIAPGKGPRDAG